MTSRSTDDLPRRILQRLADGHDMTDAINLERGSGKFETVRSSFGARRRRSGYRTTYEMLASYVSEGIVVVDKRLEEWAK